MRRISRGFTIIELLVVISVIGILATITIIGFNRFQADSRDKQRTAQATVITEALEKYYDKNGEYPSCSAMTGAGSNIVDTVLIGTDPQVLVSPQATANKTNSIDLCTTLVNTFPTDSFAYVGDGSDTCSTGNSCLSYSLQYKEESSNTIKSITSRRTTDILTSGNISNLAATPFSFSQVNLSWDGISGAASYNVQWRINTNNFTTPTGTATSTTATTSVTGLALGTLYFFRVQPVSSTGALGGWSNIVSATTFTLDTPTCTAIPVPAQPVSQLQCSWDSVANATSYTLNFADNALFTSPTVVTNATSPHIVSGLAAGSTRFFRVQAVAVGFTSGWSATVSATTVPNPPVCSATAGSSNTQIVPDWDFSAGATSYTVQYGPNNYATSISSIVPTVVTINGLNNGTLYTSRVRADVGAVSSAWTNCPNRTTGIDGPTGATWSVQGYAVRNSGNVTWMPGEYPGPGNWWSVGMFINGNCSPGATVVTRLYAYYAYSNNSSQNNGVLLDWSWGAQERYMVGGTDSWYVWWQGWVACQVGGTRVGDTYLGNAGGY